MSLATGHAPTVVGEIRGPGPEKIKPNTALTEEDLFGNTVQRSGVFHVQTSGGDRQCGMRLIIVKIY